MLDGGLRISNPTARDRFQYVLENGLISLIPITIGAIIAYLLRNKECIQKEIMPDHDEANTLNEHGRH